MIPERHIAHCDRPRSHPPAFHCRRPGAFERKPPTSLPPLQAGFRAAQTTLAFAARISTRFTMHTAGPLSGNADRGGLSHLHTAIPHRHARHFRRMRSSTPAHIHTCTFRAPRRAFDRRRGEAHTADFAGGNLAAGRRCAQARDARIGSVDLHRGSRGWRRGPEAGDRREAGRRDRDAATRRGREARGSTLE